MDEFNANEKVKGLQLTWFVKGKSLIAYDFDLKEFSRVVEFVNKIGELSSSKHPDLIIHKKSHVRVELYDKERGGFNNEEIELAKNIENIYLNNFQ